jgi:hypothetical protein
MTATIAARLGAKRVTARRLYDVAEVLRTLMKDLFDPYRPERHYMRGPGPKWHEKHAARRAPMGRAKLAVIRPLARQPR